MIARERERERVLFNGPAGCGHKAADTAESSQRSTSVCLPGRYSTGDHFPKNSVYLHRQNYPYRVL